MCSNQRLCRSNSDAIHPAMTHATPLDATRKIGLRPSPTTSSHYPFVFIRSRNRICRLSVAVVDYFSTAANYVDVHVGQETLRTRSTLVEIEEQLSPDGFSRIHRSTIVNVERIKSWNSLRRGDCFLMLQNGARLRVSRRYRERLEKALGQSLRTMTNVAVVEAQGLTKC